LFSIFNFQKPVTTPTHTPRWLAPLTIAGAFTLFAIVETISPLRRRREPRRRRTGRNLAMSGLSAAAASALEVPLLIPLAARVERRRLGLLHRVALPRAIRRILGVLLLDYTLWWWHWLNHKAPPLWRFHLVHHVDRDMDASTALRFHFGEMSLSVFYRMAQVRFLGIDRTALSIWQLMLIVSITFHHSNLRLPEHLEKALTRFIVTPRMHGIHHSDYRSETDSNWSSVLSWWDILHGTLRLDIPQETIDIGVPAYDDPGDVTLPKLIAMPFVAQRRDWIAADGLPRIDRGR